MSEHKRPVVGVMTGQFDEDNSIKFASLMAEEFAGEDIDLRFYFGAVSTIALEKHSIDDIGFGCHHFSIYSYSNYEAPDVLVLVFGSINVGQKQPMDIHRFLEHLPRVPVILLKEDTPIPENPGSISVNIDNYGSMKECVLHLIQNHGKKKICFLSGPISHSDSRLRLAAYRDALKENGIPYDPSMIYYGDYQSHVDHVAEQMFQDHPDMEAVVSANDDMATAVYRVAKLHGRKPGEDLAVTAFDDIPIAAYMEPPLTTVVQDYQMIARTAAEKIRNLLKGRRIETQLVPARFVCRNSCGCRMGAGKAGEITESQRGQELLMDNWMSVGQGQMQSLLSTLVLRNLQMSVSSEKEFFGKLAAQLFHLKTRSSFVCLLPEPVVMEDGQMLEAPERLKLYMRQDGEKCEAYGREDAPDVGFGEMKKLIHTPDRGAVHMTDFILFHGRAQYGVLSVEISLKDAMFYEILSLQIGSAIFSLRVSLEEQAMHQALEEKNEILKYAASHDELTGILNRTGVMSRIVDFIHEKEGGREGSLYLVMADLDHLKQINDNFGHAEGDSAIRTATRILQEALPEGSPLGRSGGDEYMAVMFLRDAGEVELIAKKVKDLCREYNEGSGKGYYVDVSVGFCRLKEGEVARELKAALKSADDALYEAKKRRRPSVLR
ncbi:MAG: GGDEF domain-containing protein [Lachnospiraceae bacterium]|nr:GGDEF domain-containing protein [Lachnospiraceae bacterium]